MYRVHYKDSEKAFSWSTGTGTYATEQAARKRAEDILTANPQYMVQISKTIATYTASTKIKEVRYDTTQPDTDRADSPDQSTN